MNLLFTLLIVGSSTTFLCFCDEVGENEIVERIELVKDTGRHEKDDITAKIEYKIADTADNKMEDTYTEERKKCNKRIKGCVTIMDCCNGYTCRCNIFGTNCHCKSKPFQLGINDSGIECCK